MQDFFEKLEIFFYRFSMFNQHDINVENNALAKSYKNPMHPIVQNNPIINFFYVLPGHR